MILIIGSEQETHSKYVFEKINKQGIPVRYFDSRKYPENLQIGFSPNTNDGFFIIDNEKIFLKDIQGVYWRWFYGVPMENTGDNFSNRMVLRERTSALNSMFKCMSETNWLNCYDAIEMHKIKTYQLNLMAKNNIRIPKTIITNNSDELIDFYEKNNKKVIYKPVLGGAMTKQLTDDDLNAEKLSTLKTSPVQLQEFVEGIDIRVFVMGKDIYPAEIKAKTIDFRADDKHTITPVELPDNVNEDCLKALKLLQLGYSGIDIRKSNDGEYVFIEANPAPMFIHFENVTKYPISQKLIELLTKQN